MIRWAVTAWSDAFAAIEQMPKVFGAALLAVVALNMLDAFVIPSGGAADFGPHVLRLIVGIVRAFLLTPAAIAVHRFVILQERTSNYRLDPGNPRTNSFFLCAVAVQALISIPALLFWLTRTTLGFSAGSAGTLLTIILVVWISVTLRTLILFPAIAVDAPGVGWSNAMLDTQGQLWRMLFVVIVTATPIFAIALLEVFVLGRPAHPGAVGGAILLILGGLETIVTMAVYAALASRIFLMLGNRLAGQAAGPGQA